MIKLGYLIVALTGFLLFNSCSNQSQGEKSLSSTVITTSQSTKSYGAYLAGRIAHLRKKFDTAADYYIKALNSDPENKDLLSRTYVILASKGRIHEAAHYADIALRKGDKNNIIYILQAVDNIKQNKYQQGIQNINNLKGPIYNEFINPLIKAWAYAGTNAPDKALNELHSMSKDSGFRALYHFHAGMLNDYFGRNDEARKHYEVIVKEESLEMSLRSLQMITNFYMRMGEKDKAIKLSNKYADEKLMLDMLNKLADNIKKSSSEKTPKLLTSPQIGLSEALFSIAATLRQGPSGLDLAHIFICLSIYSNPNYDFAQLLLADILENRDMPQESNEVYDKISEESIAYFTAQVKKANNYITMQDYRNAEILLKSLVFDSEDNYQLLLDLGDVLRLQNKPEEAIKFYQQALQSLPEKASQRWVLYYALGVSYESSNQWQKAEDKLLKANDLAPENYLIQNYLGYSWLKRGKNIETAFDMIVNAYNQSPTDGHITDSLGWAFYQLEMYDTAIKYLEKAAELEPANALINDHLGDAYWLGGRKNEARFQWNHALTLPDDSGEIIQDTLHKKISRGPQKNSSFKYDIAKIKQSIKKINQD